MLPSWVSVQIPFPLCSVKNFWIYSRSYHSHCLNLRNKKKMSLLVCVSSLLKLGHNFITYKAHAQKLHIWFVKPSQNLTMLHKFIILTFIILYFRTHLNSPCLLAGGWTCLVMNLYPTVVNSHKRTVL